MAPYLFHGAIHICFSISLYSTRRSESPDSLKSMLVRSEIVEWDSSASFALKLAILEECPGTTLVFFNMKWFQRNSSMFEVCSWDSLPFSSCSWGIPWARWPTTCVERGIQSYCRVWRERTLLPCASSFVGDRSCQSLGTAMGLQWPSPQ